MLDSWQGADGPVEVIADSNQRRYLVRADAPCLLVLGEVFYPWWRATLDDAEVEIARVNHAMLGIAVPAGSHVIRLRLAPRSVQLGGALTLISLLAWAAVLVSTRV